MQTANYWQQFESTGRVEDYLSYRGRSAEDLRKLPEHKQTQTGESPHAGIYKCNGNRTETDAFR